MQYDVCGSNSKKIEKEFVNIKIKWNTNDHSVITEYRINFEWETVEILDVERYLNKKLISEFLQIYMQKNGLNLQSDTEGLYHTYLLILNDVKQTLSLHTMLLFYV